MYCKRRRVRRRGDDDDGVVHRAGGAQALDHLGDGRFLLADGDVDADDVLAALVDDRVDGDGRLARLAVADDQLALAAADGRHGVDGLDAGLQRLIDRLPAGDAGSGRFDGAVLLGDDRALAVERVAERIDDPADHGRRRPAPAAAAGAAHLVALGDVQVVAEDDDADRVLFEVERQAADAGARELDHLAGHDAGQAVDAGDAVADLQHPADLAGLELRPVLLDLRRQDRNDLVGFKSCMTASFDELFPEVSPAASAPRRRTASRRRARPGRPAGPDRPAG